jgi:hypothetical protein
MMLPRDLVAQGFALCGAILRRDDAGFRFGRRGVRKRVGARVSLGRYSAAKRMGTFHLGSPVMEQNAIN